MAGSFNVSYRWAKNSSVSHTWIALHRCVESNAQLTGEPFSSIFSRLEKAHGFSRSNSKEWPGLAQIHAAADQLKHERTAWKKELSALIKQRKVEKQKGIRQLPEGRLKEMTQQQNRYVHRPLGYFGWRKLREADLE